MTIVADGKPAIYLDYCATTPTDARVVDAMMPFFLGTFGNAASQNHAYGREASVAVEVGREQAAELLACNAEEIVWTSGATEANNLAIKGVMSVLGDKKRHILTQTTEHKAILDPILSLQRDGYEVTILEVDSNGRVDPAKVRREIRPDTALVSIMWANNELGTLMPVEELASICTEAGVVFHTDASQAVGKIATELKNTNIDLLSLSGHKLYGPKGIGALVFRRSPKLRKLSPIIEGGGHERGIRSGTLNVPAIVGLGKACEIARGELEADGERVTQLRDSFESRLLKSLSDVRVNAGGSERLPNVSNLAFLGIDAESLLIALEAVAASTGSACTTASLEPSHVLQALGISTEQQRASVRFSFGRQTTGTEVSAAVDEIVRVVGALRSLSN